MFLKRELTIMESELSFDEIIRKEVKKYELRKKVEKINNNMDAIIAESRRVQGVASNSSKILDDLDKQFERCTGLTSLDVSVLFFATALQIVRQYCLTQFPQRLDDQTAAKNTFGHTEEHSNRSHKYYNPSAEEILTNPVPFDANIGAAGALAGGGSMGHRVTAIGHDPILGLVFGTANIATSTLTNNHFESFHIGTNTNNRDYFKAHADTGLMLSKTGDKLINQGAEGKTIVGVSLMKEIVHLNSDIMTKHSLPLPVISVVDPQMASTLAEHGLDMANVVNVGKQATYSTLINTLVAMFHSLFYDKSICDRRLYEVRTRKILSYSNLIATCSNLIYIGASSYLGNENALKNLDIGGLMVTIYRVTTDHEFIRKVKEEFIEREFLDMIRGKEYDFQ